MLSKLYAIPGNAGIESVAKCVDLSILDLEKIAEFCLSKKIDIVIVGPEAPLAAGISDYLEEKNIKVFGCSKLASQLESSKAFTKQVCDAENIPTASYKVFYNIEEAISYVREQSFPIVVKADGLAAGKGVIIAESVDVAEQAIQDIFSGEFGHNDKLVIEEFLEGIEASLFAICDGKKAILLGTAGDHKRIGEGDTGLNTGGMGTYAPHPLVTPAVEDEVMEKMINPTLKYMQENNMPFKGVLFAGLILTQDGVKLIEYNVRLGDPEAQSIIALLDSDFLELVKDAVDEKLEQYQLKYKPEHAVTVVMSAQGYPQSYKKNTEIHNIEEAEQNALVFHAGTVRKDGKLLANGGRVLNITGVGKDLIEARDRAYKATAKINWPDGYYRRDIAKQILSYIV
jgi:phosphoribosylamine--glycine ligase